MWKCVKCEVRRLYHHMLSWWWRACRKGQKKIHFQLSVVVTRSYSLSSSSFSLNNKDVYGYGIILWELATREEVYQGLETTQIIAKVANENLRPPVPDDCPWKDIMVKCWAENPLDRLEFRDIVKELTKLQRGPIMNGSMAEVENEEDDEAETDTEPGPSETGTAPTSEDTKYASIWEILVTLLYWSIMLWNVIKFINRVKAACMAIVF